MAKKLDIDLEVVKELATKGYNVTMICSAIGISRTTAYEYPNIINTIKAGHDLARQKVLNDLMTRSESDQSSTATIFLAKQLKIFEEYYPTATPKTPEDAIKKIQAIYKAVAGNELNADKANHLVHYLEVYIKAHEVNELQKEVDAIKEMLESK